MYYSSLAPSDILRAIFSSVRNRAFSRKQTAGQKIMLAVATLAVFCLVLALSGPAEAAILALAVFLVMRWIHLGVFDLAGGVVFAFAILYSLVLALAGKSYDLAYKTVLGRVRCVDFPPRFPYNAQTFTNSLTGSEINSRDGLCGPKMPTKQILSPNLLTVARAMGAVLLVVFHGISAVIFLPVALVLALTDLFDGVIARTQGRITDFGKHADPIADRMLLFAIATWLYSRNPEFWGLAAARIIMPEMPVLLIFGIAYMVTRKSVVPRAVFWGRLKFVLYLVSAGSLFLGNVNLAWVCLNAGCIFAWVATASYITRFYQESRGKSIFNGILEWLVQYSPRIQEELYLS